MNTFEFIQKNFGRFVLENLSQNYVRDSAVALTKSHTLYNGKPSRLTGWAVIHSKGAIVQSKIISNQKDFTTGDERTRYQAWADALDKFSMPVCLLSFTQATMNIDILASWNSGDDSVANTRTRPQVDICGCVSKASSMDRPA